MVDDGENPSLALDHQQQGCPRPHPTPQSGRRSPPSHVIHTVHRTHGQAERSHPFPQPSLLENEPRQRSGQRAKSPGTIRHNRDSSRGHATRPPPNNGKAPSAIQGVLWGVGGGTRVENLLGRVGMKCPVSGGVRLKGCRFANGLLMPVVGSRCSGACRATSRAVRAAGVDSQLATDRPDEGVESSVHEAAAWWTR